MPHALIISSHVAGSRVGGYAQTLALSQFKIDCAFVPTVLYGRHPGWGLPGGGAVPAEVMEGMLEGLQANGLYGQMDLVITGYFTEEAQVLAAARAIDAVRAAPRNAAYAKKPRIIVDPTIGDAGKGLYVPAEVAEAIIRELVPRADVLRANAWELERITGAPAKDPIAAVRSARLLAKPVIVSSVVRRDEIGVVYADRAEAWFAAHGRYQSAPNGVGDLLTALWAACVVEGQPVNYALARSVGGVVEVLIAAQAWESAELPLIAAGARVKSISPTVRIERMS